MSWVRKKQTNNILKMTILSSVIYRFNVIPFNLLFPEVEQKHFTIHMGTQSIPNSQRLLEKKNTDGEINLPDFSSGMSDSL